MFEPATIRVFMGGCFSLKPGEWETTEKLAATFDAWAKEVRGWTPQSVSEAEICCGEIKVTLKDGVY